MRCLRVKNKTLALIAMVVLLTTIMLPSQGITVRAAGTTYYVATTGNDSNNGTNLSTPFKTIQKAASVMTAGDTCYVRGGVYRETVTPAHSGTTTNPILFKQYNNEEVTISGSDLVTGWTQHSGSIYKATVNWDYMNGAGNTLFVDGALIHEARWPNSTNLLDRATYATVDSSVNGGSENNWTLTDSALNSFPNDYWNGAIVYVQCNNWSIQTGKIVDFNGSTGTITHTPLFNMAEWYTPRANDIYCITGSLNALDTANEWYKDTSTNTLYLWVSGGGNPSSKTVEFRRREYAFDLSGKSHIQIEGINLRGSQVNFENASNCTLKDSLITGADKFFKEGMNNDPARSGAKPGIYLEGEYNTIRDSEITDMFWSAIQLGGQHNRIINNYIHHSSVYNMNGNGILMSGIYQLISHNTINSTARSALSGQMTKSVIQYNEIFDTCKLTGDTASVYLPNSNMDNTQIHHNIVHENQAHYGSGIYFDNFCSNTLVYNNVVYNNSNFGIQVNVPANFTLVYNNTIYNKGSIYSWAPSGTKYENDMYGTKYINNIQSNMADKGSDTLKLNNYTTTSSSQFTNAASGDFTLASGSGAIDYGVEIEGVTDGFSGSAPDAGAYESGQPKWQAGHDFANPPNPVYALPAIQYQNNVSNNGFEYADFTGWQTTGTPKIAIGNGWDYRGSGIVRTNTYSAVLDSGEKIEQTINGLKPNTTYVLSGFGKVSGEAIEAENYSTASVAIGEKTTYRSSGCVGYMQNGDYLSFANIDFGSSALFDKVEVGINNTSSSGTIEVRRDSPSGTLLGTIALPANHFGGWQLLEQNIQSTTGTHDVYLVFKGTGNICLIDRFRFFKSSASESVKLGVKGYLAGGAGDTWVAISSLDYDVNEQKLEFTTGSNVTSVTIYAEKPSGNYVGYVDDIGLIEKYLPSGSSDMTSEDFENGLSNWVLADGTPTTSTAQKHSGSHSLMINADKEGVTHTFITNQEKSVSIWFYDDANDTSMIVAAFADADSYTRALGVNTNTSTSKYVYRVDGTWTATNVTRTTGWHELKFDYTSGTKCDMYIDSTLVASPTGLTYFNKIALADWWADNKSSTVYFDDISITDGSTPTFSDGFESGFGNWAVHQGSATTSTAQKHSGTYAYELNEDRDGIVHNFSTNQQNKASIWFYDDASDTSLGVLAYVDASGYSRAIGVNTGVSSSKYVYRVDGTYTATNVSRTTGWHELTFDYTSGTKCDMYIDGTLIASPTGLGHFTKISLADWWADGKMGNVYFDDIRVFE